MKPIDIKTKRVWKRITPAGYLSIEIHIYRRDAFCNERQHDVSDGNSSRFSSRVLPLLGHAINDPTVYPDI